MEIYANFGENIIQSDKQQMSDPLTPERTKIHVNFMKNITQSDKQQMSDPLTSEILSLCIEVTTHDRTVDYKLKFR